MLTKNLEKIVLLNPVRINYDLQKHNPNKLADGSLLPDNFFDGSEQQIRVGQRIGELNHFGENENFWDGITFNTDRKYDSATLNEIAKIFIQIKSAFTKPKGKPSDFFMKVKKSFDKLEKSKISDKDLAPILKTLEKAHQKAAMHTLVSKNSLAIQENILVDYGFVQYQTEESLIKFIKQCKRGLVLSEIEYFERVIPTKVMLSFDRAEQTKVFDNYLILYFDPNHKKNEYYEAEKDPIMFGVIRGSKKLYYIDSWVDEHCNLTYDKLLESKGAEDFQLEVAAGDIK